MLGDLAAGIYLDSLCDGPVDIVIHFIPFIHLIHFIHCIHFIPYYQYPTSKNCLETRQQACVLTPSAMDRLIFSSQFIYFSTRPVHQHPISSMIGDLAAIMCVHSICDGSVDIHPIHLIQSHQYPSCKNCLDVRSISPISSLPG